MRALTLSIALGGQILVAQQPAVPATAPQAGGERFQGIKVVRLTPDVRELQQASLDPNGGIAKLLAPPSRPAGRMMDNPAEIPLPGSMSIGDRSVQDAKADIPTAATLYFIDLQSGERLTVTLETEERDQLIMRFMQRTRNEPMSPAIRRANMAPTPVRSSRIVLANGKEPYQAMLLIYGRANHPFKLTLDRSK